MPLSEHEQKMLDQLEQALAAEDPKFASQMKGVGFSGPRGRRALLGAVGVLAGLGVILAAVWTTQIWLGVAGFVGMVAAAFFAFSAPRTPALGVVDATGRTRPARRTRRPSSFMDRMDERWDRRDGGR